MEEDFYAILGILPNADSVVISAVYRVLAAKYHPDRWKGDPAEANARMAEVNRAYSVLRDPQQRRNYDAKYAESEQYEYRASATTDNEFNSAINDISEKWQVVTNIYPNLQDEVLRLKKYSSSLAFAYMVDLLENREFNKGLSQASGMIDEFLTKYFSANKQLKVLAARLIEHGNKQGAHELNKYVTILGPGAAGRIEHAIYAKYGRKWSPEFNSLLEKFKYSENFYLAVEICNILGYTLRIARGFAGFGYKQIDVYKGKSRINQFGSRETFQQWLRNTVIPQDAP